MEAIRAIVDGASSLWERLDRDWIPSDHDDGLAQHRLRRWIETVADGDEGRFTERLARDGLTRERLLPALGLGRFHARRELPAWSETLAHLIAAAQFEPSPSSSVPFAEVLQPLAAQAHVAVRHRTSSSVLSDEAIRQLLATLLIRFSSLCTPAIASELALARALRRLRGATAEERYRNFLAERLGTPGALLRFLTGYPVLGRLLATMFMHRVDAAVALIVRLDADREALQSAFGNGAILGEVVSCRDALSDPHHGQHTVKMLTFYSGLSLMYKPRGAAIDATFARVVHALSTGLRTTAVLDRHTHSWAEVIVPAPCTDEEGAARYYRNAGSLLALLYTFGASDIHRENVIATAGGPVAVDLETLIRPTLAGATSAASPAASDVRSIGLLPLRIFARVGSRGIDPAALSDDVVQDSTIPRTVWRGFGTDVIEAVVDHPVISDPSHQPTLHGQPIPLRLHESDLVEGFETTMRDVLHAREQFRLAGDETIRFVNRSTQEYAMILERSLDADSLRDGAMRSIRLDLLSRSLLSRPHDERWPLIRQECHSLEQLDIPYFALRADDTALTMEDGTRISLFRQSAAERMAERIDQLHDSDVTSQVANIRDAIRAAADRA